MKKNTKKIQINSIKKLIIMQKNYKYYIMRKMIKKNKEKAKIFFATVPEGPINPISSKIYT